MQLIKINPIDFGIEETKAEQMVSGLIPTINERAILSNLYADIIVKELTTETLKEARELRLKIRNNRTQGVEKWHKANKEFYLAGGRFVDAIKNKEIAENIRMEDNLEQIEKHFENIEKQRISDLQNERESLLMQYNVENVSSLNLGNMPDDIFDGFLMGCKIKHDEKVEAARLAAEAEVKRLEEEKAERERISIENERLKAEAEAKEKELAAERAKVEAEKKAAEDALRIEREAAAAELRKQHELARIERERIEKENQRIAAELQAKKDADAKAERERREDEERQRNEAIKAAKAPVKLRLNNWVDGFVIGCPLGLDEDDTVLEILKKFEAFKVWAKAQIEYK